MKNSIRCSIIIGCIAIASTTFGQTLGTDGKAFFIKPSAFIGETPPAQMAANTVAAPATDLGVSTKVMSSSSVNFTWQKPSNETPQVYIIQRSTDAKNFENVGQVWANNPLTFTDKSITEGTQAVQYRVVAYMQDARMKLYTPVSVKLKREE